MEIRKNITETDLLDFLRRGEISFPPLEVIQLVVEPTEIKSRQGQRSGRYIPDAILGLRWQNNDYFFAVEYKRLWTPKAIQEAIAAIRKASDPPQLYPLVMVPFLPQEQLIVLEEEGISGLDLCGNGIVMVPDQMLVYRTGNPNRFRTESTIKNIYRRNSSMVARIFLLKQEFNSLGEVSQAIIRRGGFVTMATISKVCKTLESDLVIEKGSTGSTNEKFFRLLQGDKLLDRLRENYKPPEIKRIFSGKCSLSLGELEGKLQMWMLRGGEKILRTGASSVDSYAVMAHEAIPSFYCSDLKSVLQCLDGKIQETSRFANVNFLETQEDFVYFDWRSDLRASPIQTYLELAAGDKRDQETAEQVRKGILKALQNRPKE